MTCWEVMLSSVGVRWTIMICYDAKKMKMKGEVKTVL